MKFTVPKGETYIGGRGEMAVKANEICGLTKNILSFYICKCYCNNETDFMRRMIGLQELSNTESVKLHIVQ